MQLPWELKWVIVLFGMPDANADDHARNGANQRQHPF